jgi:hypothetical protein
MESMDGVQKEEGPNLFVEAGAGVPEFLERMAFRKQLIECGGPAEGIE